MNGVPRKTMRLIRITRPNAKAIEDPVDTNLLISCLQLKRRQRTCFICEIFKSVLIASVTVSFHFGKGYHFATKWEHLSMLCF